MNNIYNKSGKYEYMQRGLSDMKKKKKTLSSEGKNDGVCGWERGDCNFQ